MATPTPSPEPLRAATLTEPTLSRLRTVTGIRFPRKCACGCGVQIPRDPEVRYVVDFGAAKPHPAYHREHSPDFGTYRGNPRATEETSAVPGFRPASELPREPAPTTATREVAHEDAEESATPTRRFSLLEITSGLPDDSREADEKEVGRRLRDVRGRVKAARAVVATTPGLAETLQRDWKKAARFFARFGITETLFREGVRRQTERQANRGTATPTVTLNETVHVPWTHVPVFQSTTMARSVAVQLTHSMGKMGSVSEIVVPFGGVTVPATAIVRSGGPGIDSE